MRKRTPLKVPVIAVIASLFLTVFCVTTSAENAAVNKEIHVFIEEQMLIAFENGEEVYSFDIVTGRDGKETEAGKY